MYYFIPHKYSMWRLRVNINLIYVDKTNSLLKPKLLIEVINDVSGKHNKNNSSLMLLLIRFSKYRIFFSCSSKGVAETWIKQRNLLKTKIKRNRYIHQSQLKIYWWSADVDPQYQKDSQGYLLCIQVFFLKTTKSNQKSPVKVVIRNQLNDGKVRFIKTT